MTSTRTESRHELDLGGLDLTGRTDYGGIRFIAMAESATLGNPQPAYREIASALMDGSVNVIDRYGNREPAFQVWAQAADSALLDRGQVMLNNACKNRPLLGWRPADGVVERRIFVCHTAHPNYIFDDLSELPRGKPLHRRFDLRLVCDPWSYSPELTVVEGVGAPPVTPTTVVINDGTSATGWTSPDDAAAAPSSVSGKIVVAPRKSYQYWEDHTSEATLTLSAVDFSGTQYVSVDIKPKSSRMSLNVIEENYNADHSPNQVGEAVVFDSYRGPELGGVAAAYVDGNKLPLKNYVARSDGSIRFTWTCTDTNASSLRVIAGTTYTYEGPGDASGAPALVNRGVTFDNVQRSNLEPGRSSTGRITSLAVEYDGSARTTASVAIASDDGGLGDVLFYTSPVLGKQGYEPSCRSYLSLSGLTDTADTATVSGSRTRVTTDSSAMTFDIPSSRLPVGAYAIMPRFRFIVTSLMAEGVQVNIPVTVSHIVNGASYFETTLPIEPGIAGPLTAGDQPWQMRTLGVVALPPNEIPATDTLTSFIRIKLGPQVGPGPVDWEVDDLFLLHLGDGSDLTRVDCGEGTPAIGTVHNRLWLDQPTPFDPKPRLYLGTQADKSDAFNPGTMSAHGVHPITPGANRIYVVNTGDPYPTITYGFHKAYA